jgi:hypothetical protein
VLLCMSPPQATFKLQYLLGFGFMSKRPEPCCAATRKSVLAETQQFIHSARATLAISKEKSVAFKQFNGELKKQVAELQEDIACKARQISANKAIILAQKEELKKVQGERDELREQVDELQQAALGALPPTSRGLCLSLFSRQKTSHFLPSYLRKKANGMQRRWNSMYPTNHLTQGLSGVFAYGEPSFVTMARICHVIAAELDAQCKPLQPDEILLDWGCGAGKWLLFARELLEAPQMIALGIEAEERIFDVCSRNLRVGQQVGVRGTNVLHARSDTFSSFCPARVVLNYDGGQQKLQETTKGRIHLNIMRTAFCSPSVDVVVSTRLNMGVFCRYFSEHLDKLGGSLWKCLFVPRCHFGGSQFNVNVWFRLSPMHRKSNILIEPRMQDLVTGLLMHLWRNFTFGRCCR